MRLPITGRWSRLLALGYGISLFFWLSLEDTSVWPVVIFGCGLAVLISLLVTLDKIGGRSVPARFVPVLGGLLGSITGLGVSVAVAALMFFKDARHAHVFPDYPTAMMLAILERAPIWALAGGLVGLSLGLGWLAWRRTGDE